MVAGTDIVSFALQQRGDPYVWGAEGPDSFDCSGLVEYVYKRFGLTTPRTTSDMMGPKSNLQPVTRANLQPGDLIFSNWIGKPNSHVGIYTGQGSIIEAPEPGKTVTVTPLTNGYWSHVDGMRRVPGTDGSATGDPALTGLQAGLNAVPGIGPGLAALAGWLPNPGNVTDALTNVGTGIAGVAQGAMGVGRAAELLTRAFLPSNIIRGAAFFFGSIFVLIGIWFLAREIKES